MKEITKEIKLLKPSLEEAKKMLVDEHGFTDKKTGKPSFTLWYGDYRDRLTDPKVIAHIVASGFYDDDWLEPWWSDTQWESFRQMMEETFPEDDYDVSEIEDELREFVLDHDDSDPCGWYVKHADSVAAYYDLNLCLEDISDMSNEERVKEIRKALKLKKGEYEKELNELVNNSGPLGSLVLLFGLDDPAFYGDPAKDPKTMTFTDPRVCVMDRWNGSGHDVELRGFKVTVPFDRSKVKVDEAAGGYSYCRQVCGMSVPTNGFSVSNE